MDSVTVMKNALVRLNTRLKNLPDDETLDVEFQPVGNTIAQIHADAGAELESFVKNLIKLSDAVIKVRSNPKGQFRDLPTLPYDLWLPFKAESSKAPSVEVSADACQVFNDEVSDMASRWRPIAARLLRRTEPKRFDQRLWDLSDTLLNQYRYCNSFSSDIADWKRRLFAPSDDASNELFGRVIRVPVTSEGEFEGFIIALYRVFDEGLPAEVRQWKKNRDKLPPILLKIVEEILDAPGEFFSQFGTLRNKLAVHDLHAKREVEQDEKSLSWYLAPIYEKLIGTRTIAPDDGSTWLKLQKAVLQNLSQVLGDVQAVFESSPKNMT